jgi:hypothetical protein
MSPKRENKIMEEQPVTPASHPPDQTDSRGTTSQAPNGCLTVGLFVLMIVWIVFATGISQGVTWVLEQQIFEGAYKVTDMRWLVTLIYALVILIPALVLWAVSRNTAQRAYYAAFALAGGFTLFLAPARLVRMTASLETDALLIAGAGIFSALLRLFQRGRAGMGGGWQRAWLALVIAGLLSYPWAVWGALGSAWDTGLNLLVAAFFGLAAGQIARMIFKREAGEPASGPALLLEGFVFTVVLGIMATGMGVNGNQGLLAMAVPALGWAAAVLYKVSEEGKSDNAPVISLLVGLAVFWPMAFIDPDELAAVISLGPGELIQWANQAALVGLSIGFLASLLLFLGRKWVDGRAAYRTVAAVIVWAGALGLYFGPGQPGLYGERLFVILKDQADVSGAAQIKDYNQRRAMVYQTLVAKANTSQAGLRQTLDRFHIPYQPYYLENSLEVQGGPLVRWWLASRPEVDRVLDDPILRPLPEPLPESSGNETAPVSAPWNLKMIGADRVWLELKVTGKGIVIGQSDSGVDGAHPELSGSYRGRGGNNNYNWYDAWYHTLAPTDIGGHGTHTLGTALGKSVGVAPGAEWIGCVNLARNLGNPALYLDCMQFMLAPFPEDGDPLRDGKPELGAQVLNNSWGCPWVEGCDPDALLPAVKALRAAGIFVVASAGNEGQGGCATVSDPIALYAQVYSAGAVDGSGALADFSSTGPVEADGSGRLKPDVTAPGVDVLSAFPGDTYSSLSGTSMAGPHVAGVVALMWSANPALVGNIDLTQQILNETASPYTGPLPPCVTPGRPNDGVGYGIVNAYEAVKMAMEK